MKWIQPAYLLLLLALPVMVLLTLATERYWQRVRVLWSGQQRRLHWRSQLRLALVAVLFVVLPLALAGLTVPSMAGQSTHERMTLVIGLDVSKSMLAEDVLESPEPQRLANRLNLGRSFINDLLNELENERVGLFFFARDGMEVVPPTRDHGFIRYILRHTDMGRLTDSGSDLVAALTTADNMMEDDSSQANEAVVLITDGEDTENTLEQLMNHLQSPKTKQRPVYSVRVGSEESVLIPIRKPGIPTIEGFYTDEQGITLQTRASDARLQHITALTQGANWHYRSDTSRAAQQVVDQILQHAQQTDKAVVSSLGWLDLSSLFLMFSLALYSLYMMV
ncbi:MAG: VWA domain-containing protein [Deltaproteobacteria bacterium]|nr:VWA domain-containing protein [Deltaproteobacteria bacterium]